MRESTVVDYKNITDPLQKSDIDYKVYEQTTKDYKKSDIDYKVY